MLIFSIHDIMILPSDIIIHLLMILVSKYANPICECITYYVYVYQLHCPKQDVLRTSKLLPKVVIYINIIRYTQPSIHGMF
jgi:hypothetical protein